jgi:hypothetical protein
VGWSATIVDVDDERLNVFASGARCVSLSSVRFVRAIRAHSGDIRTLGELPRHGCGGQRWMYAGRQTETVGGGDAASGEGVHQRERRCYSMQCVVS